MYGFTAKDQVSPFKRVGRGHTYKRVFKRSKPNIKETLLRYARLSEAYISS